jgi:DNA-directed RNA polymerase subunit RPC12/RpoP
MDTMYVCGKCGRTTESGNTAGWLIAQRKDQPEGHLIIRCPKHANEYSKRLAGLPQQNRTKRIAENIERGLYVPGPNADALASVGIDMTTPYGKYIISYFDHEGLPWKVSTIATLDELIAAMRQVEPDLRKWRLAETE